MNCPPCLKNETDENNIDLNAHLKSPINHWFLLLSIVLQNIQFRRDFGMGRFFDAPCIFTQLFQIWQNMEIFAAIKNTYVVTVEHSPVLRNF